MKLGLGLGFTRGGTFGPNNVSDLALWTDPSDASTITDTAGSVDSVADKSGRGNNAAGGGGTPPVTGTRTINGLNALDYQGASSLTVTYNTDFLISKGCTLFVVADNDDPTDSFSSMFTQLGATGTRTVGLFNADASNGIAGTYYANNSSASTLDVNSPFVSGTQRIVALRYDPGTSFSLLYDRTIPQYKVDSITISTPASPANIVIGNAATGSLPWDGIIGEALWYARALTDGEIDRIGSYLANKWGAEWVSAGKTIFCTGASQSNDTLPFTDNATYTDEGLIAFQNTAGTYYGDVQCLDTSTSGYPLRVANASPPSSYGYVENNGSAGVAYTTQYEAFLNGTSIGNATFGNNDRVKYVRLHSCEGDATDTKANIKTAMGDLIDLLVGTHGSGVTGIAYVSPTYAVGGVTDADWQALKEARIEGIAEHSNGIAESLQFETYHLGLQDSQHMTPAAYTQIFTDFANLCAYLDGKRDLPYTHPTVQSATYSGDEVTITLSENVTGTEFGHFRVEDDGVAATINSMSITDNVITLTLASSIVAGSVVELWVNYGLGSSWTLANLPLSASGRPIKTTYEFSVAEA